MSKYFIKIFGCQYNEWDEVRLRYMLNKIGLVETVDEKSADIFFVLACAVRKTAIDRAFGKIKNWKNKKIIVSGCILDADKERLLKKGIIIWDINKPEILKDILQIDATISIDKLLKEGNKNSAYLPIMTGCNNFCTYCAVPYTKGREISRPMVEIVKDFKDILATGKDEIILLGQNVNSYQVSRELGVRSQEINSDFVVLLETLNKIPGDFQISFTSNHPKDMSDEIITAVRDLKKVKKEIHLPLQSGSNKILKAMNRPYTKEQYLKIVEKIKKEIPSVKISTDTIIGFPGETEADFQETVEVLKKVNYFQSFNNKYSPREGTAAWKLGDPITWQEKERRWRILNEISNKK